MTVTASLDPADDPVDAAGGEKKEPARGKGPGRGKGTVAAKSKATAAKTTDAEKTAAVKKAAASKAATTKRPSASTATKTAAVKEAASRTAAAKASSKSAAAKTAAAKTAAAKAAATKAAAAKAAAEKAAAAKKAAQSDAGQADADEAKTPDATVDSPASAPKSKTASPRTKAGASKSAASQAKTTAAKTPAAKATSAKSTKSTTSKTAAKKTTARSTPVKKSEEVVTDRDSTRRLVAASNSAAEATEARPPRNSTVVAPATTPDTPPADPEAAPMEPEAAPVEPEATAPETDDQPSDQPPASEEPAVAPTATSEPATEESAETSTELAVTTTDAVRIRGLVKRFGDQRAVDGVDLTVPAGSFYGLVGPNGAGKTTTLSIIAGLLRPDEGTVHINGIDQRIKPLAAKRMMGVLPDRLRTFDRLTGRQLLYYYGQLRGLKRAVIEKRTADLARAFDLTEALSRVVSDYSAGMTKKVMLAGAMIHSPRVLVLDEPFEAVDPVSSGVILDILRSYVAHGGTVILSSHGMDLVERVCSRVAVIVGGEVLAEGTIDEVRAGQTLEARFVELSGAAGEVEGLEWLHTFSD